MPRIDYMLLLLVGLISLPGYAQNASGRREELAQVQEMLADPDPMMRLANMETIMTGTDQLKQQLATRIAFASDDVALRSVAVRKYIALHPQMTFEIQLPPTLQKQYEDALGDRREMHALVHRYPMLHQLGNASFRLPVRLVEPIPGRLAAPLPNEAVYSASGDRVSAEVASHGFGRCFIDVRPTGAPSLDGTLACGNWPKLVISAPIS